MADTPTATLGPARSRWRRTLAPALILLLAGATVAASAQQAAGGIDARTGDGDGHSPQFEATADYFGQAVARTKSEPYRFRGGITMDMLGEHVKAPDLMTGERDGTRLSLKMDL